MILGALWGLLALTIYTLLYSIHRIKKKAKGGEPMFVSLEKGNKGNLVAMADIDGDDILITLRNQEEVKNAGYVPLDSEELLTLCKRAIKKGLFTKKDL